MWNNNDTFTMLNFVSWLDTRNTYGIYEAPYPVEISNVITDDMSDEDDDEDMAVAYFGKTEDELIPDVRRWLHLTSSNAAEKEILRAYIFEKTGEITPTEPNILAYANARQRYDDPLKGKYDTQVKAYQKAFEMKYGASRSVTAEQYVRNHYTPCLDDIFELADLPTVPQSLLTKSEYVLEKYSIDIIDVHQSSLHKLNGGAVHRDHEAKLDATQLLFSTLTPLRLNPAQDIFVFRGLRLNHPDHLQHDLNTVTFVSWDLSKAMNYAVSDTGTSNADEKSYPVLCVIRCYDGMPIIRTQYDGELILPRNCMLIPQNEKFCYVENYDSVDIVPVLIMFFQAVPTARPRTHTRILA